MQTVFPFRVDPELDTDPSIPTDLCIRYVTPLPYDSASLAWLNRGAAFGLRTDFRRQLGEPKGHVRLLDIVEAAPESILQVIEKDNDINMLCHSGLVSFAVLHPESGELAVLDDGIFHGYQPQNLPPDPG